MEQLLIEKSLEELTDRELDAKIADTVYKLKPFMMAGDFYYSADEFHNNKLIPNYTTDAGVCMELLLYTLNEHPDLLFVWYMGYDYKGELSVNLSKKESAYATEVGVASNKKPLRAIVEACMKAWSE